LSLFDVEAYSLLELGNVKTAVQQLETLKEIIIWEDPESRRQNRWKKLIERILIQIKQVEKFS